MNEGGTADVSTSPGSGGSSIADELADLRRQVVFLQGQVEDRDRSNYTGKTTKVTHFIIFCTVSKLLYEWSCYV